MPPGTTAPPRRTRRRRPSRSSRPSFTGRPNALRPTEPFWPDPNSRVTSRHFELGEGGDPGVHVEIEPPVGVHMLPDQRCQSVQVSGVQSAGPVRASENPLEHLQLRNLMVSVGERVIAAAYP